VEAWIKPLTNNTPQGDDRVGKRYTPDCCHIGREMFVSMARGLKS
jgi:hypothetical protein